jgi:hypothetical protein
LSSIIGIMVAFIGFRINSANAATARAAFAHPLWIAVGGNASRPRWLVKLESRFLNQARESIKAVVYSLV